MKDLRCRILGFKNKTMTQIKQLLNKNLESYVKDVEKELLFLILKNMNEMQGSMEKAENLAQEFLNNYPYADKEILIAKLREMGNKYPEAYEVYIKYANEYYSAKRDRSFKKALSHIKKYEITNAIKAAKGGNRYNS